MVATYVTPQVLVFQEFSLIPDEITDSLRALIMGPHARLARYSDPDEKLDIFVGDYDPTQDNLFPWPRRPAGAVIDHAYVKVFVDDAQLQFYQDLIGEGEVIAPVAGSADRIRIAGTRGWKQNGAIGRLLGLGDRDVQVGDRVHVRGVSGSANYTLDSYVRALVADQTVTVTGPAVADTANWGTQSASETVAQVGGLDNALALAADISGYSAYKDGNLDDVYTVTVTQGSVGSDLRTAVLRITSASGSDDDLAVQPSAAGTAFAIGHRGLELTFSRTGGNTTDDLVVGQSWTVTVVDGYTALAGTSGGTYSGTQSTTYAFECIQGGNFADPNPANRPIMRAYTTTGVDSANPITLNAVGTAYPVGTRGITFTFTGTPTGIAKGDKFYIAVTGSSAGRVSTLVLGHSLPTPLLTATDLDVTLYVLRNIQVEEDAGAAPNWEAQEQQLVLYSDLTVHDEAFTASGVPIDLTVNGGGVYIEYRAWLDDLVGDVGSIYDVGQLDAMLDGALHPDNPLKWGVYKALANSNGTQVKFTAVTNPSSLNAWADAIALLVGRDDVYNVVPLTHDREVQDLVAAHCNDQSSPERKAWRTCFINLRATTEVAAVSTTTSTDGGEVLARILDDPNQDGTQHVLLTVTSGNGAFLVNKVKPGDVVRTGYALDMTGVETWDSYVVDDVRNEDTLLLLEGPTAPITVPQKIEIWHTLTKNEIADDLALRAGSFGSRRVKAVWPDQIGSAGVTMPGYFLCCALAGLRSGVVPQQGMTNLQVAGFDDLSRTTKFLNGDQLDTMAKAGAWIVTQDHTGNVFTRHALTTDRTSVQTSEEMITANLDSISYLYARLLAPFIGIMNVTTDALLILQTQIDSVINYLRSLPAPARIGPQVIDATVISIRKHQFLPDRVVAIVNHTLPFPLNNLELHVVI
jgi:hypothetical protein